MLPVSAGPPSTRPALFPCETTCPARLHCRNQHSCEKLIGQAAWSTCGDEGGLLMVPSHTKTTCSHRTRAVPPLIMWFKPESQSENPKQDRLVRKNTAIRLPSLMADDRPAMQLHNISVPNRADPVCPARGTQSKKTQPAAMPVLPLVICQIEMVMKMQFLCQKEASRSDIDQNFQKHGVSYCNRSGCQ